MPAPTLPAPPTQASPQNEPDNLPACRAQHHPQTDLPYSLSDPARCGAVNPDTGQNGSEQKENTTPCRHPWVVEPALFDVPCNADNGVPRLARIKAERLPRGELLPQQRLARTSFTITTLSGSSLLNVSPPMSGMPIVTK